MLDLTAHMLNLNEIRYVPPEKCVSRTHEVLNQKTPSKQIDVSAESVIVREKTEVPEMAVTSALQVQEAFQRKGIALVFADLIEHDCYSRGGGGVARWGEGINVLDLRPLRPAF